MPLSCKKEEPVVAEVSIRNLTIDGKNVYVNGAERTVSVILPGRTDFTSVPVEVEFEGEGLKVDGKSIESKSNLDLTKEVTITVYRGNNSVDYRVSAKNTSLPVVRIDTPSPVISKTDWVEGATIRIEYPDGTLDYEGTMSIRGRGNSTWNYPKKPYAIKLDSKSKILGMPKHKRWVLLANWKDRTLLRNDAAFFLSRAAGMDYTVRGEFVELIYNSMHMGNYYLCEQIKIDKNRVNITEMDPLETDPEKISGGFLMELDTYFDEVKRFRSPLFDLPYMFKQPDEDELSPEAETYFKNYITELETLMKDDKRVKNHEYEEYLDVDSAIEFLLVNELANNTDFYNMWPAPGIHSGYMYKDRGGKLFTGPVWDFDYHGFVPDYSKMWAGATQTLYYPALFKDYKFYKRTLEIWEEKKAEFAKLPDYIYQQADRIMVSETINHIIWPIVNNPENGDEQMSFEEAVDRMVYGFKTKFAWMDENLKNLAR